MEVVVDSERVEDGDGFLVDLFGVYAELLEERRLVVESGGAADGGGGEVRGGGEGGGGCGGVDVEGEEGDAGIRGSRGLEWGGGKAALLGDGGASAGAENHRRNVRHLIEGDLIKGGLHLCLNFFVFFICEFEDVNSGNREEK